MEERSFKAICSLLATKAVHLSVVESIFLTQKGVCSWFSTDSKGNFRRKNFNRLRIHSALDLLAYLIDDHRSRERFDSNLTEVLCWLTDNFGRRTLEIAQAEFVEGRNALMAQVKLVQTYLPSYFSNEPTFLLSMKYLDSSYVTKFRKIINKERTLFKHPRLYSKALNTARLIVQHIEESCKRRVLTLSCEFMLDSDGRMLLINTADCRLIEPQICIQQPLKTEADLASLITPKKIWSSKSRLFNKASTEPPTSLSSRACFRNGQLRNIDSFKGQSIPFKLDLESSHWTSAEGQSYDNMPQTTMSHAAYRTQLPQSSRDTSPFMKVTSKLMSEHSAKRRVHELSKPSPAPHAAINDNFVEIIIKTFEQHEDSHMLHDALMSNSLKTLGRSHLSRRSSVLGAKVTSSTQQIKTHKDSKGRSASGMKTRGSILLRAKFVAEGSFDPPVSRRYPSPSLIRRQISQAASPSLTSRQSPLKRL
jgi:hypothetical protein